MANKSKQYPIPKFDNLEEEDLFWRSHSPLMEGYEGKVQKKKQKRASFLSVRLTGEELAYLRQKATLYGLGPSTYARQILVQAMELGVGSLPTDLLFNIYSQFAETTGEQKEKYCQQLNQIYKEYLEMQDVVAKQIVTLCKPTQLTEQELKQFKERLTTH